MIYCTTYTKEGDTVSQADEKKTKRFVKKIDVKNMAVRKKVAPVYEFAGTMVASLLVLVIVFTFFVRIVRVDGASMDDTLIDGDQILLSTNVSEYERGDIVVIDRYTVAPLIKRIIAVGGDTLKIEEDGTVYLNGAFLSEPYVKGSTPQKGCTESVIVPSGYVFVMGDNRMTSHDSRAKEIGLISVKDIIGKAVYRVAPMPSFGGIYDNLEQSVG